MTAPSSPALGTTEDAATLIPGDPGAVRGFATTIRDLAGNLENSGDELKSVSVGSWQGEAAQAFEDSFNEVPGVWFTASDLLEECATALDTYADAITTAQANAQLAIDAWNEGQEASEASRVKYNSDVTAYNNRTPSERFFYPVPQFWDTGAPLRKEAEEILEDAREALDGAGDEALTALVRVSGGSMSEGSAQGPGAESSWSWGGVKSDQWKQQWGDAGWADLGGPSSLGLSAVLASATASAWVWRARGSASTFVGPGNGRLYAEGDVTALNAGVTGSLSASDKGVAAKLTAEAELVGASGSAGWKTDYSTVEISGDVGVGAYGEAKATFGAEGVDVGAEVLLGAKASVDAEISAGGVGFTGEAEGWAGAGAGADATFSYDDGKLTIGAKAGLAWGLGGSLGGAVTLDFEEMGKTATDIWDTVSGWW